MFEKEAEVDGERVKIYLWLANLLVQTLANAHLPFSQPGTLWEQRPLTPLQRSTIGEGL